MLTVPSKLRGQSSEILGKIPTLGFSGSATTFTSIIVSLVRFFRDCVFLADRSGANTKQLSISHGGQQFMVSPTGNGSG